MVEEQRRESRQILSKERLQGLIDAIFAFAMTLLVVDLSVPTGLTRTELNQALSRLGPNFYAYVISFILLATFWVAQHRQFHYIRHTDNRHIWIIIIMLLFVASMPFSTSLLADYSDTRVAEFFFAGNLMGMGLALTGHWVYATVHHHLVEPDLEKGVISNGFRRALLAPGVAALVMIVSIFDPQNAAYVYIAIPLFLFTPPFRTGPTSKH